MDLDVVFAGTAGSVPTARRGLPATLIRRGGERILIDCGEGTQRQLIRSVGLADIDVVFITHLHLDHWLGLPGMIKSFELRDRMAPLTIYGPPGIAQALGDMKRIIGKPAYGVTVTELERYDEVERDDYRIAAFPVNHRGVAYGYALIEDDRPGRFDAELAASRGVTPGPDFGRLQRGEVINGVSPEEVIGPTRAGRKIVFSGDTAPCQALQVAAHHADLLVHEATFLTDEAERAAQTRHSTARQAALTAEEAEVRLLALTHLSTRYGGREIREEARLTFPDSIVPRDFDIVDVPFPEKGPPVLLPPTERPRDPSARGTSAVA
jgi:ribonuclease Z